MLPLHRDAIMILIYQFLGELKTVWPAIYRLDGDHWVTEEASLDDPNRHVFPAPLLSSRDLNCVE